MATTVTETEDYYDAITIPEDDDDANAASVEVSFRGLASRAKWLAARLYEFFGVRKRVTLVTAATDVLTSTAHGLSSGDPIRFTHVGGSVPAPLAAGTIYYARDITADTFKVAATSGGSAIDITSAGSGTIYVWTVPDAASYLYVPATSPFSAGTLRATLTTIASTFASQTAANTWTLAQTFSNQIILSGTNAVLRFRGALYGAPGAAVTLTVSEYDSFQFDEPAADSVVTLKSTSPAPPDGTRAYCYTVANFGTRKITFKNEGATTLATFPVVANKSWVLFQFFNSAWYPIAWGGGTTPWV